MELEKSVKNENDNNSFLVMGALGRFIFPEIDASALILGGIGGTYLTKPLLDRINGFKTLQSEMLLYATKNTARILIGATTVEVLRYLF